MHSNSLFKDQINNKETIKQLNLTDKLTNLTLDNKEEFKKICNKLVVAIKNEANIFKNINVLNTYPSRSMVRVTITGLTKILNKLSVDILDSDSKEIISLCTHNNINDLQFEDYPPKLKSLLQEIGIDHNNNELNKFAKEFKKIAFNPYIDNFFLHLSDKKLNNIKLTGANLSNMDLNNVDLSNAILSGINLSNTNLSNSNLSNTDLSNANLTNSNLENANLSNTNLFNSNLENANLSNTNLENAYLKKSKLNYVNFTNANLKNINLSNADLTYVNFTNTNLAKTNLNNSDISFSNFDYANLSEASLIEIVIAGANFTNAIFSENTKFIPFINYKNINIWFNHLNNSQKTILTTINSIDDKYKELKLNLMNQVIKFLETKDITSIKNALNDILHNQTFDYSEVLNKNQIFTSKINN